jgi:glutamine amidotransferase
MLDYKNKNISIGVINLRCNNIFSIINILKDLGFKIEVIDKKKIIKNDILLLPGVGSFPKAASFLKKSGLDKEILKFAELNKPIVGICLGMQLLFDQSDEFKKTKGLSLITGKVKKIPLIKTTVPNIGWQQIKLKRKNFLIKESLNLNYFYFIHSYFCLPKDQKNIMSLSKINNFNFCSSIKKGNIYGMQFHPEKSGKSGIKILKNLQKII